MSAACFSRQQNVPGWNDAVIAQQTALILGTGGIGTNVAMVLARLGVKEIILTDRDTVDASNVNRQILFEPGDVGSPKVAAAKRALDASHAKARPTIVTAVQVDFVAEWSTVQPLLRRASVVFNGCDIGEAFDLLVSSACRALQIPYCAASSYANHSDFECFANQDGKGSCLGCRLSVNKPSLVHMLRAEHTLSADSCKHLCFLPHDAKPETGAIGSSVLSCGTAAQLCVNAWVNGVLFAQPSGDDASDLSPANANNRFCMMELGFGPLFDAFPVPRDATNCAFCGDIPPCRRPEGKFALAFGSEPVLLDDAPGSAYASPRETAEQAAQRIGSYRQKAAAILAKAEPAAVEDAVKEILPALKPQPGTVASYNPCTPTVPLDVTGLESGLVVKLDDNKDAKVDPPLLRTPLIKTPHGKMHGIRSGLRSAILPHRGGKALDQFCAAGSSDNNNDTAKTILSSTTAASFGALRLKGCGCVTHDSVEATKRRPFPLLELDSEEMRMMLGPEAPTRWEIRGCQFLESAMREQMISGQLAEMLAPSGFLLGNTPAAYWEYARTEEMKKKETPEQYGEVAKFCGVFHTLGDKRAETHLLTGMELLLALMVESAPIDAALSAALKAVFPPERIRKGDNSEKEESEEELVPYWAKKAADRTVTDVREKLSSNAAFRAWEKKAISALGAVDAVRAASGAWAPLWSETVAKMVKEAEEQQPRDSSASPSFLVHVFDRLGYEMGFFEGALNAAGFSWGLFFDHNPCEPHNNAHPNNFVLVAANVASEHEPTAGSPAPQYLAAVDFDMAYTKDEFISNYTGSQDMDLFKSNIEWEQREMRSVLGGNNMQSTGVVAGAMEKRLAEILRVDDVGAGDGDADSSNNNNNNNKTDALLKGEVGMLRVLAREICIVSLEEGLAVGTKWVEDEKRVQGNRRASVSAETVPHEKMMRSMVRLSLMMTALLVC